LALAVIVFEQLNQSEESKSQLMTEQSQVIRQLVSRKRFSNDFGFTGAWWLLIQVIN
jgi:hypothetical protein